MPSSVTRPMGVAASSHFVAIAWTWGTRSAFATRSIRSCDSDSRISYGVIPGSRVGRRTADRKSTRLNSSHGYISYAVFCLKKKKIESNVLDLFQRHRDEMGHQQPPGSKHSRRDGRHHAPLTAYARVRSQPLRHCDS